MTKKVANFGVARENALATSRRFKLKPPAKLDVAGTVDFSNMEAQVRQTYLNVPRGSYSR
ncbi:hypothetical protein [Rhizobium gallicum]|uniref:hypothetical protein n=1 Tax=Rhizobium gallicum TaxID=56730 RepID=UPI0012EBDB8C|nr:hypothetical protein [Rhizobium gallicum]